ncbi:MmcQ/YjbR family DNA-binding protein [Streptomyces sp. NPDC005132]|uniref:MmcQ/YjbR family DNA-binding protein n=1 Tax=Streptomyces sp. NPDC005132 TaxID=3154294 RepID=UPI0033BA07BF
MRDAAARLAERARDEGWSHEEYLAACLQREVAARDSHGAEGRVRAARFPSARQAAPALPDVSHGYPFTPGLDVYKVAGRAFLIVTEHPDDQIITVKCEPEHARALERGHASITPGRYLDKRHWISLGPGVGITERRVIVKTCGPSPSRWCR